MVNNILIYNIYFLANYTTTTTLEHSHTHFFKTLFLCEFYEECELANPEGATCVEHAGGSYCGKWRILEKQKYGRKTKYNTVEVP